MRTVYFERIRPYSFPLVFFYLLLGRRIKTFDFFYDLKKIFWARYLINKGLIELIYVRPISPWHGIAIDLADGLFAATSKDSSVQIMTQLFSTAEIELIFKKRLSHKIFRFVYINHDLSQIFRRGDTFIPDTYLQTWKIVGQSDDYRPAHVPHLRFSASTWTYYYLGELIQRMKWNLLGCGYFLLKSLLLFCGSLFSSLRPEKKHFDHVVSLDNPHQLKIQDQAGFDFILDHRTITKDNTLFMVHFPLDAKVERDCQEMGYRFFNVYHFKKVRSLFRHRYPMEHNRQLFWSLIKFLGRHQRIVDYQEAFINGLYIYFDWKLILHHFSITNYIYTNQESVSQIAKNILIHQQGGHTWSYASYIGGGLLYAKDGNLSACRQIAYGFVNAKNYVGINQDAVLYNKLHRQQVANYYAVGSFTSEIVRQCREDQNRLLTLKRMFPDYDPEKHKVVSFFCTTFIKSQDSNTTLIDGALFYKEILNMAIHNPQMRLIIKPKKNESFYTDPKSAWYAQQESREMLDYWQELKQRPNVFFAGDKGNASLIMGLSDLVVTHSFSSTATESIGAGIRSIWYRSVKKHDQVLYDNIPGLIIHGEEELKRTVHKLLYETSDEEYRKYLDGHVSGKLQADLQGRGLSRFRELLTQTRRAPPPGQHRRPAN